MRDHRANSCNIRAGMLKGDSKVNQYELYGEINQGSENGPPLLSYFASRVFRKEVDF